MSIHSVMMRNPVENRNSMPTESTNVDVSDLESRLIALRELALKEDPTEAVYACDKFNKDYPVSGQGRQRPRGTLPGI